MKLPVAPVSTIASVAASSIVSLVLSCAGIMMQLGPSSSEQIMSFGLSRLSHFGQHGSQASIVGSMVCASSSISVVLETSCISRTENQLLQGSRGTQLTHCGTQNPLH